MERSVNERHGTPSRSTLENPDPAVPPAASMKNETNDPGGYSAVEVLVGVDTEQPVSRHRRLIVRATRSHTRDAGATAGHGIS